MKVLIVLKNLCLLFLGVLLIISSIDFLSEAILKLLSIFWSAYIAFKIYIELYDRN